MAIGALALVRVCVGYNMSHLHSLGIRWCIYKLRNTLFCSTTDLTRFNKI